MSVAGRAAHRGDRVVDISSREAERMHPFMQPTRRVRTARPLLENPSTTA